MSLLCLDLRNGSLALGLREGPSWLLRKRLGAGAGAGAAAFRSADEYALLFRSLCADAEGRPLAPSMAILSSVLPALTPVIRMACLKAFGIEPLLLGPGVKTGLKIRTDLPGELGTDLVCMAVAALDRAKADCIVVNLGRILTLSAVSASGDFLGAAIAPGPASALDCLRAEAAQIPGILLERPKRVIGKNSPAALCSGILFGWEGLLDRLVERIAAEAGWEAVLVGTGEDELPMLVPARGFAFYDSWLALEGLSLIAERNLTG